jgi:hypothetical protein
MKSLAPFPFNDHDTLVALSKNKRLHCVEELAQFAGQISIAYQSYDTSLGNILTVAAIPNFPDTLKESLKKLYKNPPKSLSVLDSIRRNHSPDVCPMCGSLGSSTLDHIFPQTSYPEFCLFTRNLVPACGCNDLRQDSAIGAAGERVLHPYFDAVLSQRLICATFSGTFPAPSIGVAVCYTGNMVGPVNFHVREVVKKTNILNFLEKEWAKLLKMPDNVPEIPQAAMNLPQLDDVLRRIVARHDIDYGTPNNWRSVLFAGILASPSAKNFLLTHLNGVITGAIAAETY